MHNVPPHKWLTRVLSTVFQMDLSFLWVLAICFGPAFTKLRAWNVELCTGTWWCSCLYPQLTIFRIESVAANCPSGVKTGLRSVPSISPPTLPGGGGGGSIACSFPCCYLEMSPLAMWSECTNARRKLLNFGGMWRLQAIAARIWFNVISLSWP